MRVKLQNFTGEWVEFDIGESATILCAVLQEISGDEVLNIVRKDKTYDTYDSDKYCRTEHYNDCSQIVCVDGDWEEWFMNDRVVRESEVK